MDLRVREATVDDADRTIRVTLLPGLIDEDAR